MPKVKAAFEWMYSTLGRQCMGSIGMAQESYDEHQELMKMLNVEDHVQSALIKLEEAAQEVETRTNAMTIVQVLLRDLNLQNGETREALVEDCRAMLEESVVSMRLMDLLA